jgi:hypothetical protein
MQFYSHIILKRKQKIGESNCLLLSTFFILKTPKAKDPSSSPTPDESSSTK